MALKTRSLGECQRGQSLQKTAVSSEICVFLRFFFFFRKSATPTPFDIQTGLFNFSLLVSPIYCGLTLGHLQDPAALKTSCLVNLLRLVNLPSHCFFNYRVAPCTNTISCELQRHFLSSRHGKYGGRSFRQGPNGFHKRGIHDQCDF